MFQLTFIHKLSCILCIGVLMVIFIFYYEIPSTFSPPNTESDPFSQEDGFS